MHVRQFTNWRACSYLHTNIYTQWNVLCYFHRTMLNKILVGPIFRIVYDARLSKNKHHLHGSHDLMISSFNLDSMPLNKSGRVNVLSTERCRKVLVSVSVWKCSASLKKMNPLFLSYLISQNKLESI